MFAGIEASLKQPSWGVCLYRVRAFRQVCSLSRGASGCWLSGSESHGAQEVFLSGGLVPSRVLVSSGVVMCLRAWGLGVSLDGGMKGLGLWA